MPSSVIKNIIYDVTSSTLRIVFVSGMIYDYKDVPESVYQSLKSSGSKGTYLNKHIKNNYHFEKVN
ncbi:KTSC domain-containing protein [Ginsengibacter hankyongi]|uniref:KTSC domain-containing protein n=1 Tax=Ginsengibacter hankyongi TaxID=2607284 RepID=A0A5J5IFC2_9BACT|nr:KTSC domain-containing protein [Ginsengibacter hankyongi]KAA9038572.1 KTSC domain-containing protein [Ginsengibacter hankyongi]